ncbi:MAG: HAD family acid phosphatase [bacterium]|nr:HAD family acid phosphatase [bacterium]
MQKTPVLLLALALSASLLSPSAYSSASERYDSIPNLANAKAQVRHYYESGEWEKALDEKFTEAEKILDEFRGDKSKAAIVLDIDETVLTSYPYLQKVDFAYTAFLPQWSEWVLKAEAPAMKRSLEFYKKATGMGFPVFFVTGRSEDYRGLSEKNLKSQGFTGYAGIIHRPASMMKQPAAASKSKARQNIERQGYKIILNIGDQKSDLDGGYAENTILLPNPMYIVP